MFFAKLPYNSPMKTILFQGDSITDANRNRLVSHDLGQGFVAMLAKRWNQTFRFYNRGISGNRSHDLLKRWQKDTLSLKPDVLFILIGINDIWHEFKFGLKSNQHQFDANMRTLIQQTRDKLHGCRIIILYPFVLKTGHYEPRWDVRLKEQHAVIDRLKTEFSIDGIHLHVLLEQASLKHDMKDIAKDGVHLSTLGNQLVADAIESYLETL